MFGILTNSPAYHEGYHESLPPLFYLVLNLPSIRKLGDLGNIDTVIFMILHFSNLFESVRLIGRIKITLFLCQIIRIKPYQLL